MKNSSPAIPGFRVFRTKGDVFHFNHICFCMCKRCKNCVMIFIERLLEIKTCVIIQYFFSLKLLVGGSLFKNINNKKRLSSNNLVKQFFKDLIIVIQE